jgi:hypothetical protein
MCRCHGHGSALSVFRVWPPAWHWVYCCLLLFCGWYCPGRIYKCWQPHSTCELHDSSKWKLMQMSVLPDDADVSAPGCYFHQNVLMEASGPKPHKFFYKNNYFSVLGEKSAHFSYLLQTSSAYYRQWVAFLAVLRCLFTHFLTSTDKYGQKSWIVVDIATRCLINGFIFSNEMMTILYF